MARVRRPIVALLLAVLLLVVAVVAAVLLTRMPADDAPRDAAPEPEAAAPASDESRDVPRRRERADPSAETSPAEDVTPARPQVSQPEYGTITGRLESADGEPIAGAAVRPAPRWKSDWVITGADGSFRLVDVAPDEDVVLWAVGADGPSGSSEPMTVRAGETTSGVVVRLPPSDPIEIVGRVLYPDGNVLKDSRVGSGVYVGVDETVDVSIGTVFMKLPDDDSPGGLIRKSIGSQFKLADCPTGHFRFVYDRTARAVVVRANHGDFMKAESAFLVIEDGVSRIEVDLVLQPERTIRGRVIDDDGAPVGGATLRWRSKPGTGKDPITTSGEDGRFEFQLDHADQSSVTAYADGYVSAQVYFDKKSDEMTLRVRRALTWSGVVLMADGSPAHDARVSVLPRDGYPDDEHGNRPRRKATADKDGRFTVENVWARAWNVSVAPRAGESPGFEAATVENVSPTDGPLAIHVQPGESISGRVLDASGAPMSGAALAVKLVKTRRWRSDETRSDADGQFTFGGLTPGEHSIRVRPVPGATQFREQTIHGVAAGSSGVEIAVETGATLRGRVVDGDGRPVAGRDVLAFRAARSRFSQPSASGVTTDAHGRFELGGLPSETHRLVLESAWPDRTLNYLGGGEDILPPADTLEFVLSHGPTIRGSVRDATGQLLPGARVILVENNGKKLVEWSDRGRFTTDENGEFRVLGLHPRRTYTVEVSADDHAKTKREEVRPDGPALAIQLTRAVENE